MRKTIILLLILMVSFSSSAPSEENKSPVQATGEACVKVNNFPNKDIHGTGTASNEPVLGVTLDFLNFRCLQLKHGESKCAVPTSTGSWAVYYSSGACMREQALSNVVKMDWSPGKNGTKNCYECKVTCKQKAEDCMAKGLYKVKCWKNKSNAKSCK
jgi:hypothetical protein